MTDIRFIVEESLEGGFVARAVGQDICTVADTLADLHVMLRDAVRCHFDEGLAPCLIRFHITREQVLTTGGCRATCRERN